MGSSRDVLGEGEYCVQRFQGEIDHLEALYIDGSVILKFILKKEDGRVWTGFSHLRIGTYDGLL
jgi:hypothetical protein